MRFVLGVITGMLVSIVAAAVVALSFDVPATKPSTAFESNLFTFVRDRSVRKRSPKIGNPLEDSPSVLAEGLNHYRANCLPCHGAPGVEPDELAEGLHPQAPDLDSVLVQARTDGELFWITSNGIRMTGMPAFSPTHSETEIWSIVAFLRRLPNLTSEERTLLQRAEEDRPEAEKGHEHEQGTPPHRH